MGEPGKASEESAAAPGGGTSLAAGAAPGEDAASPEPGRPWRPSRRPNHEEGHGVSLRIVAQADRSVKTWLRHRLREPAVRTGLFIVLLVVAIITFDAVTDDGWAQRESKPKPAHVGRGGSYRG